jgi:hypothetical protein
MVDKDTVTTENLMVTISSKNNPSFALFPINNDRTGWRPFGLPVIMVVPNRRDLGNNPTQNSQVFNVRVFVEDVPSEARVAGHNNVGVRFPDRELYAEAIDAIGLAERLIDPSQYTFTRDGVEIDYGDAKEGDTFAYITTTGIKDTITYIPSANYYDLSDITIDYDQLPSGKYNQVYQAEYFTRLISDFGQEELLCIDASRTSLAILRFNVRHPGEVLEEFERHTPPPYLTNATRSQDSTLALYRPFTDALQDIMDEQDLLESVNWVFDTPAEAIPYLSQLLGWDLPYFPKSLDQLRRAVLRRTVEFQNLSGSRRAITNLFRLFGFEILISNLWWSSDGKRLIRPDENLPTPYESQKITTVEKCQIDCVLSGHNTEGFGIFNIPLLFRPQETIDLEDFTALRDGGNISIDCYFVEDNSNAYDVLTQISQEIQDNPLNYGNNSGGCGVDAEGFLIPFGISTRLAGLETVGYSQVLIEGKLGKVTNEVLAGSEIPLKKEGVKFNRETNILNITLNGALDYEGRINNVGRSVFTFVTYKRQEFLVPDIIKDLQSNRFEVQVVTEDLTEFADPVFLDFAVEFLFRVKAFHSLLNKIIYSVELNETYEVTDWCVGGNITQRFDIDAGTLQVPPAIIPEIPSDINDCTRLDPVSLGYKDEDITLRLRKLANLPEEHAVWKALDARADQPPGDTRLALMDAVPDRSECKFNHRGQDRIVGDRVERRTTEYGPSPNAGMMAAGFSSNLDTSPLDNAENGAFDKTSGIASSNNDSSTYGSFTREYTDIRESHCELDGITDYCYKGRVDDELLYRPTLVDGENVVCKPCSIDLGTGVYYLYPTQSVALVRGVKKPARNSSTRHSVFSGGATEGNQARHLMGIQGTYLAAPYDQQLQKDSHLARLYRDYGQPQDYTLHFSNRIGQPPEDQQYNLALQRPSLNIQKPTLHLPGCRFPRINALRDDFYHPTWEARPWDDDFSTYCGPHSACGSIEPTFLNCVMIVGEDGNEYLSFDSQPFQCLGNNIVPDIQSLGDHTLSTDASFETTSVIHKVYMGGANGHEAIELDGVCDYDTSVENDTIIVDDPIFSSHNECNTGELIDFADGYACESGEKTYTPIDIGQGIFDEVFEALGLPSSTGTDAPSALLIFLGSGILHESCLRLDCGCLLVDCDGTSEGSAICSADIFLNDDGFYDWQIDHLQIVRTMKNVETIGVCSTRLDGTIPSLLELA